MPKYRVAVCLEEGVVLVVDAANAADAEAEAFRLADDMGGHLAVKLRARKRSPQRENSFANNWDQMVLGARETQGIKAAGPIPRTLLTSPVTVLALPSLAYNPTYSHL